MDSHYDAIGPKKLNRSKWIIAGSVIGLIGLAVIGIAVGVTVSKNHKKSAVNTSTSSSNSSASNPASNPGSASNPSNQSTGPSSFTQDPRLKKSFYGLAYTPEGSQLPGCGALLADVITDVQLMSQLTTRIRL
jgi:cytoskeletal protein RodZ